MGQFALAFAGPLANGAMALILAATFLGASGNVNLISQPWISSAYLLRSMVWMPAGLAVLHLLPAYPLDCGRLLRGSFARKHGITPAGRAATGQGGYANRENDRNAREGAQLHHGASIQQP